MAALVVSGTQLQLGSGMVGTSGDGRGPEGGGHRFKSRVGARRALRAETRGGLFQPPSLPELCWRGHPILLGGRREQSSPCGGRAGHRQRKVKMSSS